MKNIILSLAFAAATLPNFYAAAQNNQNQAQPHQQEWQAMFPGVDAAQWPAHNAENIIKNFLTQMADPNWNGTIQLGYGLSLNNLNEQQLNELADRIRQTFSLPGMIIFSQSNNNGMPNEIHLEKVELTLEIPSLETRIIREIIKDIPELIIDGAPRKTRINQNITLAQGWKLIREYLIHYLKGYTEAKELLATNVSAELKDLVENGQELFLKIFRLSEIINTEFEKEVDSRDRSLLERSLKEFLYLFNTADENIFSANIEGSPIRKILSQLIQHQSPIPCFRAIQEASVASAPEQTPEPETTAQMLDRLLNVPGRAKEIAAAVGEVGSGWAPPTLRFNNQFWNVYRLPDPDAAEINRYKQNNMYGGYHYGNIAIEGNIEAATQKMKDQLKRLNLKEGSYVLLVRQQNADRHFYSIERFTVQKNWNHWNGHLYPLDARWQEWVGLIEIRPVHDGDPTELYNPLRTHGINDIRGTMMEQRVHEAMAENRVHQFHKLSEAERNRLRAEIDRYNDDRHHTLMENEGLAGSTLTRDERILSDDTLSDDAKAAIARARARKVSEELKERQLAPRLARLRTHGDDLTQNPEKFLSPRVHALFSADRIHSTLGLSAREREFYRENYEDSYLDTVEAAVADRQNRFDPTAGAARAHFDASQRLHAGFFDNPGYSVSPLATTDSSYDRLSDALDDYDMKKKSNPQNLNEGPENWEQEYKEAKERAAMKKEDTK